MSFFIVGLGNPGEEYVGTRHNTGREALFDFSKANDFSEWQSDTKSKALISSGKVGRESVTLIAPETFMNKSGETVKKIEQKLKVKSKKAKEKDKKNIEIENLVVVHDDLDIPFGHFKISFNKTSGGHRGVESIVRVLKTTGFVRIRVGISPHSAKATRGKPAILKKPSGEEAVNKFILGKFKLAEQDELKKLHKKISEAIAVIISEGYAEAMGKFNS